MIILNCRRPWLTVAAGLIVLACASKSSAEQMFATPSNAKDGDGPLDGTANFQFGNGSITITLTNLEITESLGQEFSDVKFLVDGHALTGGTLTSATANTFTINGDGSTSNSVTGESIVYPVGNTGAGWSLTTSGLFATGNGQPAFMIVGPGPNSDPQYPYQEPNGKADGGLDNPGHNPTVNGSATFVISLAGVTPTSTVSDVFLSFGTGPDAFEQAAIVNNHNVVPEPTGIAALVGLGSMGLIGLIRCRRRQAM